MQQEEWFIANTPYYFNRIHQSSISPLALLTCHQLIRSAKANNQSAVRAVAILAVIMTETLTQILAGTTDGEINDKALIKDLSGKFDASLLGTCQSNAELMKHISREIPYWPMLRFLNTAANSKKQFMRIAADLELGKNCPINVSEDANYSLETPINSFVWKCLRHFQHIHFYIKAFLNPDIQWSEDSAINPPTITLDGAIAGLVSTFSSSDNGRSQSAGLIKQEDVPIYKASFTLPPLTKSTAQDWADKVIMPYVKSNYPDLRKVPELSAYNSGRDGKRYAPLRKAVIQALQQMARKS